MVHVVMKGNSVVPESFLKKQKRADERALAKNQEVEATKKKNLEKRKLFFNRAKGYIIEYAKQERELIDLKREARLKGDFYVSPEPKLFFIIKIRGHILLEMIRGQQNIKILTEKLSAALVNVGAKKGLVKQHAKVAYEAIAVNIWHI